MKILELKSTMSKMKILLEGLNSRCGLTEERIRKLEDRSMEIVQLKHREHRMNDTEQGL